MSNAIFSVNRVQPDDMSGGSTNPPFVLSDLNGDALINGSDFKFNDYPSVAAYANADNTPFTAGTHDEIGAYLYDTHVKGKDARVVLKSAAHDWEGEGSTPAFVKSAVADGKTVNAAFELSKDCFKGTAAKINTTKPADISRPEVRENLRNALITDYARYMGYTANEKEKLVLGMNADVRQQSLSARGLNLYFDSVLNSRAEGASVHFIDPRAQYSTDISGYNQAREDGIAANLAELAPKDSTSVLIADVGPAHVMQSRTSPWAKNYTEEWNTVPAGNVLQKKLGANTYVANIFLQPNIKNMYDLAVNGKITSTEFSNYLEPIQSGMQKSDFDDFLYYQAPNILPQNPILYKN